MESRRATCSSIQHAPFPLHTPHDGEPAATTRLRAARRQGPRRRARAQARVPPGVDREHLGDELRLAVGRRRRGDQPRRRARRLRCRTPARAASPPHHRHGGDLVWQIGTGYFGCRDERRPASRSTALLETSRRDRCGRSRSSSRRARSPASAACCRPRRSRRRSPRSAASRRAATASARRATPRSRDVDELLDFIERIADATGLPVGIKSAVGDLGFWRDAGRADGARPERGADFITIDGGEGGTGAGAARVHRPRRAAVQARLHAVYRDVRRARACTDDVVFIGSGKLGFPETALLALALGCDMVNVAREAMLAIGCIQAQRCHTGHCPTGVATQNAWLPRGLDPTLKSARLANYVARCARSCSRSRALRRVAPRARHARRPGDRLRALHAARRCARCSATSPAGRRRRPARRAEIEALMGGEDRMARARPRARPRSPATAPAGMPRARAARRVSSAGSSRCRIHRCARSLHANCVQALGTDAARHARGSGRASVHTAPQPRTGLWCEEALARVLQHHQRRLALVQLLDDIRRQVVHVDRHDEKLGG